MQKRTLAFHFITIALFVAMSVLPACSQGDSIEFAFSPPTPLSHTLTFKSTKVKSMGSSAISQTDIAIAKSKIDLRKTPKGYKLVQTPISFEMTRNGEKLPYNLLVDRLTKAVVTCSMDASGKMLTVKGLDEVFDALADELKSAMPQEQYEKFAASLPGMKEAAVAKEIMQWNGRVADFVGRTARIGDTWVADQTAEMPYGALIYDVTTKVAGRVKTGKVDCVRVTFSYTADVQVVKKFIQEVTESLAQSPGGAAPKIVEIRVSGGGERVVDPKTMLIYSEVTDRTVTMVMDDPDDGRQELKVQEKKEYAYTYGK